MDWRYAVKKAKLFDKGRNQYVLLPHEFSFAGSEVEVRRQGTGVLLVPMRSRRRSNWDSLVNSLGKFSSDVFENRNQPIEQQEC
jgi:virulence-associated protein VagC